MFPISWTNRLELKYSPENEIRWVIITVQISDSKHVIKTPFPANLSLEEIADSLSEYERLATNAEIEELGDRKSLITQEAEDDEDEPEAEIR